MRFAIRDDDASYFTRAEQLEEVWGHFLPRVPVSLAVIPASLEPFHYGDPARFRQGSEPVPVTQNRELVMWLRESLRSKSIAVMCHGYTHEYEAPSFRQECVWKPYERLREELAAGRKLIESAVGEPVDTFVPPGNAISAAGLKAVRASFKNILTTLPLRRPRDLQLDWPHVAAYGRRLFYQMRHGIPNPFGEELDGLRLLPSFSLTSRTEWETIRAQLLLCHRLKADFVTAVHYWEVDQRIRQILERLVDLAGQLGFRFSTCPEMFEHPGSETGGVRETSQLNA